jgi:class 3 adenylate cyclase/tetratricopeptide (TPR) repeat protein
MKCAKCGHDNRTGAKFCEECGAHLSAVCMNCGAQLSSTARFCSECGHPIGQAAASGPDSAPQFAAPEAYTPRHLAEKILSSKAALEGERKQVTALFADLKSSMELFADRDPEEARRLLDPVIEQMMEAVHRYEGTVNHVLGDGIVALFGAPLAHEDHAVRACYAALRMQETVKRYAEGVQRSEGIPIRIRVGLNSGEVIVRSIGSDLRMDYTVVGQSTNVAARMEQMALPGSILISADTLALAEGYIQVNSLGPLKVKGLEQPIHVYEIMGASAVRSRLHAAVARGLSRFVGRTSELDQLKRAMERARSGHGQVVAVVGEPGVGKSRLYWEFIRSHRTEGWLIIESSSVSYGKASAFLPVIDLLRAYFQIGASDETRKVREQVTGKLLSLDWTLEPLLPALLWLVDVPVENAQWQRLDPPQRRQRALEGVKRLLLRESQVQPLLVLFEDLHWIDAETQALLDSLVESLPTARLLLLVNYRPEYQHRWGGKSYYRQLSIEPLPPENAEVLLETLLGTDSSLQALKQLLIKRTEGNPFFLEETVRTLVETKALTGERGAYRLAAAPQNLQIPATAQAILAARIDWLSPKDKRLLQAASVIGKEVPFALLQAIAELPEDELRHGLARLQAAEFLYEARLFPDLEYTFKHALTHDVAYGSLLQDRRRTLHRQIVQTIERLYSDRLPEHIDQLAHHAFRGEVWKEAVAYLRQAGAKALARSANRDATAYFEQALAALGHLPETRETVETAVDLRFDLRTSLFPLGLLSRVLGYLEEAESLATTLDDRRRISRVSVYMSHLLQVTGRLNEARRFAESARTIAEALGDFPARIGATFYIGASCYFAGDYSCGREFLRETVQLLKGDGARERYGLAGFPAVMARAYLAWLYADRGEFAAALAHGYDGVRLGEAVDHPYSLIIACWGPAYLHTGRRELSQALPLSERALALARDWDLPIHTSTAMGFLGHIYALSGRIADGLALLEDAVRLHESVGFAYYHSLIVAYLAEAYLLAGRLDDARACGDKALKLARERGERGFEAWCLRSLGEIAAHADPPDLEPAMERYDQALARAEELGMRPLVAHCHLGLGKLHRHTGQSHQAHAHLADAMAIYRDLDIQFWLQEAAAEMRQME